MSIVSLAPKLRKFVLLLGSDQPGEVSAAASALIRTLNGAGLDLHDLAAAIGSKSARIAPTPKAGAAAPAADMAEAIVAASGCTEWEINFAESLACQLRRKRPLSAKQLDVLSRIYDVRVAA